MPQSSAIGQCTDAIEAGDADTARRLLIEHHNFPDNPGYITRMLCNVASQDGVVMLNELVSLGADVNAGEDEADEEGALMRAADEGAINAVRWLVEHGAQINLTVRGQVRCFALTGAVMGGHFEVVKYLVENGADVNATWAGRNALLFAIVKRRPEIEA